MGLVHLWIELDYFGLSQILGVGFYFTYIHVIFASLLHVIQSKILSWSFHVSDSDRH